MKLKEACQLAYKVPENLGVVESIKMSIPPLDLNSYVLQVRTLGDKPWVLWIGPEKYTEQKMIELIEEYF